MTRHSITHIVQARRARFSARRRYHALTRASSEIQEALYGEGDPARRAELIRRLAEFEAELAELYPAAWGPAPIDSEGSWDRAEVLAAGAELLVLYAATEDACTTVDAGAEWPYDTLYGLAQVADAGAVEADLWGELAITTDRAKRAELIEMITGHATARLCGHASEPLACLAATEAELADPGSRYRSGHPTRWLIACVFIVIAGLAIVPLISGMHPVALRIGLTVGLAAAAVVAVSGTVLAFWYGSVQGRDEARRRYCELTEELGELGGELARDEDPVRRAELLDQHAGIETNLAGLHPAAFGADPLEDGRDRAEALAFSAALTRRYAATERSVAAAQWTEACELRPGQWVWTGGRWREVAEFPAEISEDFCAIETTDGDFTYCGWNNLMCTGRPDVPAGPAVDDPDEARWWGELALTADRGARARLLDKIANHAAGRLGRRAAAALAGFAEGERDLARPLPAPWPVPWLRGVRPSQAGKVVTALVITVLTVAVAAMVPVPAPLSRHLMADELAALHVPARAVVVRIAYFAGMPTMFVVIAKVLGVRFGRPSRWWRTLRRRGA